ncbi:MAG TPA: GntR family transcriptional regulator, partial [Clostridium sp.]|nr:GntR family transcriptional regulator [Clostridium sp.]
MIKILFDSETPIYVQLKNEIIKAIARGELEEGEALPSIRDL